MSLEKPNIKFPDRLIKLCYSNHAKSRLIERTTGSLILCPQYIRPTWENTIERKVKNGRVIGATVVLDYKKGVKMYLLIIFNSGIVKTVFFRNVEKKNRIKKDIYFKKEYPLTPKECFFKEEICSENSGTETAREERIGENVGYVSGNMGRKENWWAKLFRVIRRITPF